MPRAHGILGRRSRAAVPATARGGSAGEPAPTHRSHPRPSRIGRNIRVRALLSVANRDGISTFARDLLALDVEVFATDGTRDHLAEDGIDVAPVSDLTQVPAMLGGQVKTFHPAVYAGILARRDRPEQLAELEDQDIGLIDLVVVNVKPFGPEIGRQLVAIDEAIEMIDVGGAALLGAAARNAAGVAAVASPAHYAQGDEGAARARTRRAPSCAPGWRRMPSGPSPRTTPRSRPISTRSPATSSRDRLAIVLEKVDDLRYGENPHQRAAFYRETTHRSGTLADAIQAPRCAARRSTTCSTSTRPTGSHATTPRPTVAIVKHTDPVGLASNDELVEAYRKALETDPVASFGGIVGGEPRAGRRRRRARSRRTRTRRSSRPASASPRSGILQGEGRARDPLRPARPDRGDARLRHREPRLQADRRRPARGEPRRPRPRPRPAAGRHASAARRSRS